MAERRIARLVTEAIGLVSCGTCRTAHDSAEAFVVVEDGLALVVCPACAESALGGADDRQVPVPEA